MIENILTPFWFTRQLSLPIEKFHFRFSLLSQHYLDHIAGRWDPHPHEDQETEKIYKFRTGKISCGGDT